MPLPLENIRVLDLCGKYALSQEDRLVLEQYRPYIVMMNVRAKASILFNQKKYTDALEIVQEGLDSIKEFFAKFDEKNLAFLYQDTTASGAESRFFKFVSRETVEQKSHSSHGNRAS